MVPGLRAIAKAMGLPPAPTVRAPALDPTCERLGVRLPGATLRPEPTRLGRAALETCLGLFSPVEHLERCWHLTVCQWTEPDSAANVVGSFFRFFARLAPLRLAETLPIAHESLASIQL